jgi:hypothetical protein
MSAIKGFVILGSIAAVPIGLAYGHAAYAIFSTMSSYEPRTDDTRSMRIGSRVSHAYATRTGVFASRAVDPDQAEKDRRRNVRREEIRKGIRSELEWMHNGDLLCTL